MDVWFALCRLCTVFQPAVHLTYISFKQGRAGCWMTGSASCLAAPGAVGCLSDRGMEGHVVDFPFSGLKYKRYSKCTSTSKDTRTHTYRNTRTRTCTHTRTHTHTHTHTQLHVHLHTSRCQNHLTSLCVHSTHEVSSVCETQHAFNQLLASQT